MKPLAALGLVLVIVGALVALALPALRPVGGALVLCGVALVVFGMFFQPRSARRQRSRGPYSWETDERGGPRELYTAQPGDVHIKSRQPEAAPEFTEAHPGTIPIPRRAASGGPVEYTAAASADIPEPREREHAAAEYTPTPRGMPRDDEVVPGPAQHNIVPDLLNSENPDMPPMVPPPPRT